LPSSQVGTTGIHIPTIEWVVDWLRGDEAERVRADAIAQDIPPEDALAQVIEVGGSHEFSSHRHVQRRHRLLGYREARRR
jgi:hypothetical protein